AAVVAAGAAAVVSWSAARAGAAGAAGAAGGGSAGEVGATDPAVAEAAAAPMAIRVSGREEGEAIEDTDEKGEPSLGAGAAPPTEKTESEGRGDILILE